MIGRSPVYAKRALRVGRWHETIFLAAALQPRGSGGRPVVCHQAQCWSKLQISPSYKSNLRSFDTLCAPYFTHPRVAITQRHALACIRVFLQHKFYTLHHRTLGSCIHALNYRGRTITGLCKLSLLTIFPILKAEIKKMRFDTAPEFATPPSRMPIDLQEVVKIHKIGKNHPDPRWRRSTRHHPMLVQRRPHLCKRGQQKSKDPPPAPRRLPCVAPLRRPVQSHTRRTTTPPAKEPLTKSHGAVMESERPPRPSQSDLRNTRVRTLH